MYCQTEQPKILFTMSRDVLSDWAVHDIFYYQTEQSMILFTMSSDALSDWAVYDIFDYVAWCTVRLSSLV